MYLTNIRNRLNYQWEKKKLKERISSLQYPGTGAETEQRRELPGGDSEN